MFDLIQSFDDWVLQSLAASRTEWVTVVMKVVSFCGEWYVLLPVAAIVAYILLRRGFVVQATELAYVVIGTSIAVVLLKTLVARPRPPEVFRIVTEVGYSFPSWHAAIAIAFWGYVAYFAAKNIKSTSARFAIIALSLTLIFATDFSRLYLGAHYFSDVAGGTLLGAIILLIAI